MPKKPRFEEPMTIAVPYDWLEHCAEQNCCDTLDMHTQSKSHGKVIEFAGAFWVCVGSCSQYLRYNEANLHRCVPEQEYTGPSYRYDGETPELYYPGGRLKDRQGKVWIMTDEEIRLVPEKGRKR